MTMGGIFPDTVASIRLQIKIRTSLVVMALVDGVQWTSCHGMKAPPHLTSYPEAATDGADITLSCTPTQGGKSISVKWHRNNAHIFDTSKDDPTVIIPPVNTSPEYQSVSGRISVSSSLQQHNVTLRTNSTLDQGSVWRCKTGAQFSNNLTVELKESNQEDPVTTIGAISLATSEGASSTHPKSTTDRATFGTDGQHTGKSATDDKDMMTTNPIVSTKTPFIHTAEFIYVVAGSAGAVVIVVFIVIIVLLCIRRERKCQTNDKADKKSCKEGGHNEEFERETIVMEDNELYHGFVKTKNQELPEEQQVADVYAKVNKVRKTHNATEVQITLSIEDLYAKPNKPASSEASHKVSSSQNEDVNTPD